MNHFQQIAEALAERDLDGMLLTGEANRFYASGFHSTGTDGVALVTAKKNYYFTDPRYLEAAGRTIKNAQMGEAGHGQGYVALLKEAMEEQGLRRVGFEDAYMTAADYASYREKLPCELVPATKLLWRLRQQKDEGEIAAITAAQRIAEHAFTEILKEIQPGVMEREIAAKLQYLMLREGAQRMSFDPIVVSGENGSMPHGVPSEKRIQSGEFVTMDFGCVYQGYCSDMTRTVAVGAVTDEMRRVYETVLQAQTAGIAAARAGVTGSAIDAAARAVIDAAGYGPQFTHSFGHGVGVEIHELPNAAPSFEKPMTAGVVISAEPGIYLPGRMGVRIEDMIALTETGSVNLTNATKELLIL